MAAAAYATLWTFGPGLSLPAESLPVEILRVAVTLAVAMAVFGLSLWACGGRELRMLLGGRTIE